MTISAPCSTVLQRVMAAGHGGQILVADSTASLLSGVDLIDLGPRRLRDVPIPVGVFQVRAPGLQTEFPPLRTVDRSSGNLRPQTTSFIGRKSELVGITALVRVRRLVTLTGTGGVGKTRLALEIATQLADEFPDGVWIFELAAVADPAAVPDAVAAVLGITEKPGKTVAESVATALEGRVRLLVFDNCEHVFDATAELVDAILATSTTVRILATSREGVGGRRRAIWPVRSLTSMPPRSVRRTGPPCGAALFRLTDPTRSPRSADVLTGSRWPSNWRPRACRRWPWTRSVIGWITDSSCSSVRGGPGTPSDATSRGGLVIRSA